MANPTYNDTLMSSLSAQAPGTIADRERKRLEAATGTSKKSLTDLYKLAGERQRIIGQKSSIATLVSFIGATATASSNWGAEPPSKAIDGLKSTPTDGWTSDGVVNVPQWVRVQFASSFRCIKYALYGRESGNTTRNPTTWKLQGSNDGVGFTDIHSVTGAAWSGASYERKEYTCDSLISYLYYRINITANNGDPTYTSIIELEFFQ